ncbi:hypothetical protein JI752_008585 [Lysobacter sp. MMG2]|uniref:hypothetical protein n=1 Tax=Lysobacter sp. MMG2 TaxID=2801338 RepID=UPI001C249ECF|nr:hypothetical protein [Lysobacter sp. MMG2]MBU8976200.1 hypothetical protein [Lysobacter sp. MMG2]
MKARIALAALVSLVSLTACQEWNPAHRRAKADAASNASSGFADRSVAPAADLPPVGRPAPPPAPAKESRLVPFEVPASRDSPSSVPGCEFGGLPSRFNVYAAGAYSGRKLDYQIDQSGHTATQIDVAVSEDAAPVVLMLGAYEPTVWNIGWSPRTRIVAVLVSGYHRQAVAGLPPSVPRINSSYDNKGQCGQFYVSERNLGELNPIARRVFGQRVTRAYIAQDGFVAIGDGSKSALVTDANQKPEQFRDPDAPLAGEAGLREAVAKGLLREARSSDMQAWASAFAAIELRDAPPVSGAPPRSSRDYSMHNAYVVVRPLRIPAGLYGAHSATFIVPKGVQRPTGDPGHSSILDWNTMTCAGATCRMR